MLCIALRFLPIDRSEQWTAIMFVLVQILLRHGNRYLLRFRRGTVLDVVREHESLRAKNNKVPFFSLGSHPESELVILGEETALGRHWRNLSLGT